MRESIFIVWVASVFVALGLWVESTGFQAWPLFTLAAVITALQMLAMVRARGVLANA